MRYGDGWMGSSSTPLCLTDDEFECVACEYYNTAWCWVAPADTSSIEDPEAILPAPALRPARNAPLPFLFSTSADEGGFDAAVDLLTNLRVPLHLDHIVSAISSSNPGRTFRRTAVLQALRAAPEIEEVGERTLVFRALHPSDDAAPKTRVPEAQAVSVTRTGDELGALSQMLANLPAASLTREDEVRLARAIEIGVAARGLLHVARPRISLLDELAQLSPVSDLVARYSDLPTTQPIAVRYESPRFRHAIDGAHPERLLALMADEFGSSAEEAASSLRRLSILTAMSGALRSDGDGRAALATFVSDSIRARDVMAAHNLRLVVWVARRFGAAGLPWEDLIQEGSTGLLRAIERFDYRMGNKFSTYAVWWIRQSITRAIANTSRLVRIPVWAIETMTKAEELPDDPVSLDRILESFPTAVEELVVGSVEGGSAVEQEVIEEWLASDVQRAMEALTERERKVLSLRFGLDDGVERTLAEIGEEFHVTRERIRQIEAKALRTLRGGRFRRIFEGYHDLRRDQPDSHDQPKAPVITRVPINRRPRRMRLPRRSRPAEGE